MKIYRCKKCQFDLIKVGTLQYKCPVCGSRFTLDELSQTEIPINDLYNELIVAVKALDEENVNRIISLLNLNSPNNALVALFEYFILNKNNLISLENKVKDFIDAKLNISKEIILDYIAKKSNNEEKALLKEIFKSENINVEIKNEQMSNLKHPKEIMHISSKDVLICYCKNNEDEVCNISNKLNEYNISYRLLEITCDNLNDYLNSSKLLLMVVSKNLVQSKNYLEFVSKANLVHELKKINYLVTDLPILVKHKYNKNKLMGIELFKLRDVDVKKLSLYIIQGLDIDLDVFNNTIKEEETSINEVLNTEETSNNESLIHKKNTYEDTLDNNFPLDTVEEKETSIEKLDVEVDSDDEIIANSSYNNSTSEDDDFKIIKNANILYENKKYTEVLALLNNLYNKAEGIELMTRIYISNDYEGKNLNIAYNLVKDGQYFIASDLINDVGKELYATKKFKEARDCFRLAGYRNNVKSLFNLGIFALNGLGGDKDLKEASEAFLKVIPSGDDMAKYYYAIINLDSTFEERNIAAGIKYLKELAESGMSMAQYRLGTCYYYGQGVPKRLYLAKEWLEKASEQGNGQAKAFIDDHLPN